MFKKFISDILGGEKEQETNKKMTMDDAIAEARKTLPDYLEFYAAKPEGAFNHRVKVHFSDSYGDEHIWVTDFSVEGDQVRGIVGNQPQTVECVEAGEEVFVPMSQVSDWGFQAGNRQYGNYTVYIMFNYMSPQEVEMYIEQYGFTENPLEKLGTQFSEIIESMPKAIEEGAQEPEAIDFDEEVERRLQAYIAEEDEELDEKDIKNIKINIAEEVFEECRPCASEDERIAFKLEYGSRVLGYATAASIAEDKPEFEPIAGVSLEDYSAATAKISQGVALSDICNALGISESAWQEVNQGWGAKMGQDTSFTIAKLFSQYMADADKNPKVGHLKKN